MDASYLPIDRYSIRPDAVQPFDIFFKSSDGKPVLYCASGNTVSSETCAEILERRIEKLFILKKDWSRYNLYVEENLDSILTEKDIAPFHKASLTYRSISYIAEQLFRSPKAEFIRRYRNTVMTSMGHVFADDAVLYSLIGMTSFDFTTFNHSINVGIFSLGLLREFFPATDIPNIKEVAAGFFLHDIGKSRIPPDILHKRGALSKVEWKCMRGHVEEGLGILDEHNLLTRESKIIVSQHHERHDGSGYPKGLRGDGIHVYAKICSIADVFDGLTSHRPWRKEFSSFEAMRIMKAEMFKDFDPVYFEKFVRLFSSQK